MTHAFIDLDNEKILIFVYLHFHSYGKNEKQNLVLRLINNEESSDPKI